MDISSLTVRGETRARRNKLVETKHSEAGIPDSRIFQGQSDAPDLLPVVGAGGENEAGMIERIGAAHNELGIGWIDDWPVDIAVDVVEPLL